jgi:hypothetical protein
MFAEYQQLDEQSLPEQPLRPVLRIQIHRIHMFLGLLDPDPDPSIIEQK